MDLLAVVAIIAVVFMTATRASRIESRRRLLHDERMAAIEKGVPIPEDAELERSQPEHSGGNDLALQGTILTALGLGMFAASHLVLRSPFGSQVQQILALLEVWAYPVLFVGLALLVFAAFSRRGKKS